MRSAASLRRSAALMLIAALCLPALAGCGSSNSGSSENAASAGSTSAAPATSAKGKPVTIGIALIAPINLLYANIAHFKSALAARGYVSGKNVKYVSYNADGQLSNVPTIVSSVLDKHPKLVYLVGTPIVQAFAQKQANVPIVFGAMDNPVDAKVVKSLTHPGGDATGTDAGVPARLTLSVIAKTIRGVKRIGVIGDPSEENTVSTIDDLKATAKAQGITVVDKPIDSGADITTAMRSLGDVQALVVPDDNLLAAAFPTVAKKAEQLKIPTFSLAGGTLAKAGMTVAIGPDYNQLGTEAGNQAAKILEGTAVGDVPVAGLQSGGKAQIGINLASARAVGLTIPAGIRRQASLVYGK